MGKGVDRACTGAESRVTHSVPILVAMRNAGGVMHDEKRSADVDGSNEEVHKIITVEVSAYVGARMGSNEDGADSDVCGVDRR